MSIIALRAWHKQEKKMYYNVEHTTYSDGSSGISMLGDTDGYTFSPNDEDCETSQRIAFHDKNGKQAYEGDILLLDCLGWGETYQAKIVVVYRDFQWRFHMLGKPEDIGWNVVDNKWEPESEIIGNRWEHPELLEVAQ